MAPVLSVKGPLAVGISAPDVLPIPRTKTRFPELAAAFAASNAPSSWSSPSVMTTIALPTFLLLLNPFSANSIAAPMFVPWRDTILVDT